MLESHARNGAAFLNSTSVLPAFTSACEKALAYRCKIGNGLVRGRDEPGWGAGVVSLRARRGRWALRLGKRQVGSWVRCSPDEVNATFTRRTGELLERHVCTLGAAASMSVVTEGAALEEVFAKVNLARGAESPTCAVLRRSSDPDLRG